MALQAGFKLGRTYMVLSGDQAGQACDRYTLYHRQDTLFSKAFIYYNMLGRRCCSTILFLYVVYQLPVPAGKSCGQMCLEWNDSMVHFLY